jgi:hypothetical protein
MGATIRDKPTLFDPTKPTELRVYEQKAFPTKIIRRGFNSDGEARIITFRETMNGPLPSRPYSKRENPTGENGITSYLNISEDKGRSQQDKKKYMTANDSKEYTQDQILTFGMGDTQPNEGENSYNLIIC